METFYCTLMHINTHDVEVHGERATANHVTVAASDINIAMMYLRYFIAGHDHAQETNTTYTINSISAKPTRGVQYRELLTGGA